LYNLNQTFLRKKSKIEVDETFSRTKTESDEIFSGPILQKLQQCPLRLDFQETKGSGFTVKTG